MRDVGPAGTTTLLDVVVDRSTALAVGRARSRELGVANGLFAGRLVQRRVAISGEPISSGVGHVPFVRRRRQRGSSSS